RSRARPSPAALQGRRAARPRAAPPASRGARGRRSRGSRLRRRRARAAAPGTRRETPLRTRPRRRARRRAAPAPLRRARPRAPAGCRGRRRAPRLALALLVVADAFTQAGLPPWPGPEFFLCLQLRQRGDDRRTFLRRRLRPDVDVHAIEPKGDACCG